MSLSSWPYNFRGQAVQQLGPYTVTGSNPTVTFYSPNYAQVATYHRYAFDSAGRQTVDSYEPKGAATQGWKTLTTYDADRTTVDPPVGGTPSAEITDARGASPRVSSTSAPPRPRPRHRPLRTPTTSPTG